MIPLADVGANVPVHNDGGLKDTMYLAFLSDIATFPTRDGDPDSAVNLADLATISTDITFNVGKKFTKLQGTYSKNNLNTEGQGEIQSKSAMNTLTFHVPGNQAEVIGLVELIKNQRLVVVAEDRTHEIRVLGEPGLPALVESFSFSSGENVGAEKIANITFKSEGRIAPHYKGNISLTPAV